MSKQTDIQPIGASLYFLPVRTRVPLKFGGETLTTVTCARVCLRVRKANREIFEGWGETPLSVQWVWPGGRLDYETRHGILQEFCLRLAKRWAGFGASGHAIEIGCEFIKSELRPLWSEFNQNVCLSEPMPWLAALVCCSAFDIALHDAYGMANGLPVYETYNEYFMNTDLARWVEPACNSRVRFAGKHPADFLQFPGKQRLAAWHLVGGKDAVVVSELSGAEPQDGYPVLLTDWIERDGLRCLKIKLRGDDADWDYARLVQVGRVAIEKNVLWLTADFNCTVSDPQYVNGILDRLLMEHPRLYGMILYVEQPFPYELETNQIDVHSVSARKPLFMDESAHDWELIRMGRELGWTGVALKTCKTQTGAILSACWAKAHGMTLMVQDLTNPMLAQIPHVLLAAHVGTIMGVETNAVQFYPEASAAEAKVHPGLYQRRDGEVDLTTLSGPGFGSRLGEIARVLPAPAIEV